jgi:hypothetical protein
MSKSAHKSKIIAGVRAARERRAAADAAAEKVAACAVCAAADAAAEKVAVLERLAEKGEMLAFYARISDDDPAMVVSPLYRAHAIKKLAADINRLAADASRLEVQHFIDNI